MSDQADYYAGSSPVRSDPITTNDATPQTPGTAIYVGTGGTIVGRLLHDTADRTWKNVPSGSYVLGAFILVKSAGTTAADMLMMRSS